MFILKCESCSQQVNISPEFAGSVVKCPVCGKGVSVPQSSPQRVADGADSASWAASSSLGSAQSVVEAARTATGKSSEATGTGSNPPAGSSMNFSPSWSQVTGAGNAASASLGGTMAPPPNIPAGGVAGVPMCSRLVYVLLAVFLGTLGIHNFVAGLTGRGATQLAITLTALVLSFCTFGLSMFVVLGVFVWSLVDIVTIRHDARGVLMN